MYTPEQLKQMPYDELEQAIEKRLGRKLTDLEGMWLAITTGASKHESSGVQVFELDRGISYQERIDWEKVASFLNHEGENVNTN